MGIEEVGHIGHVEALVALDDVLGTDKLSAANLSCLLQHLVGPKLEIVFLSREGRGGGWLKI